MAGVENGIPDGNPEEESGFSVDRRVVRSKVVIAAVRILSNDDAPVTATDYWADVPEENLPEADTNAIDAPVRDVTESEPTQADEPTAESENVPDSDSPDSPIPPGCRRVKIRVGLLLEDEGKFTGEVHSTRPPDEESFEFAHSLGLDIRVARLLEHREESGEGLRYELIHLFPDPKNEDE